MSLLDSFYCSFFDDLARCGALSVFEGAQFFWGGLSFFGVYRSMRIKIKSRIKILMWDLTLFRGSEIVLGTH